MDETNISEGSGMKVLLINPVFSGLEFDSDAASIPIGLAYVASSLKNNGIEVKIVDCLTNPNHLDEIRRELPSCTWVGMSVMTTQIPHALFLCKYVRTLDEDLPIVWGGPHPTLFAAQTVVDPRIDIVVRDEGEETAVQLTKVLQSGDKDLSTIQGISFKSPDGRIVHTARRKYLDMDDLPFINYDLLDQNVLKKLRLFPSHTSRGCSHRCAFCINPITGCGWRGMSPNRVLDELQYVTEKFPSRKVRFWDENFFNNPRRSTEIMEGIIARGITADWETTVRADYFTKVIDDKYLALIKKSGCYKFSFGAESGSPRILRMLKKDVTAEELVLSARKSREYGITPEYSFMIGMPNEERADMLMTLDLIYRLYEANPEAELIGPQPYRPYPGSPLDNECEAWGWSPPTSLQAWADLIENEWSFLSARSFPWVKEPDFVEALWPYLNFALTPEQRLMEGGVKVNSLFKRLFILASKTRWKLKFFDFPIEYQIANKYLESRTKEMKTCPFDSNGEVIG